MASRGGRGGGQYYGGCGRGRGNVDGGAGRGRGGYYQGGGGDGGGGRVGGYYQGGGGDGGGGRGGGYYQGGGEGGRGGRGGGYYQGGGEGGRGGRGGGYYQGGGEGGRGGRSGDGGGGRGGGYYQGGGGDGGGGRGGGYYQGGGGDGGGGRGDGYYQGVGGDGGGAGRGRGYEGYQGGGGRGVRGRGGRSGHHQGGNDYGGGRDYQQGGNDYGGGRSGCGGGGYGRARSGGQSLPVADLRQAAGPPLAERYAAEAAELRQKFMAMDICRAEPMFPARPGFGTGGRSCMLKANHFFVGLVDKGLHQYDVTVSPESTLPRVYRAVMSRLVTEHQHTNLGGRLPAYDGRKSLYTAGELPFKTKDFEVTLTGSKISSSGIRRERKYKVTIKHATLVSLQQLQMLMAEISTDIPAQALQALDIVLRDVVLNERNDLGYVAVGRSFFSPNINPPKDLGLGIEAWKGFYQSIRPTQSGLSLNIDMSTTAFIQPLPLIDFVEANLKRKVAPSITRSDYVKMKKALRGLRIEVTHRGEVCRKYRISGLTLQSTRDMRFQLSTGVSTTVKDYFRDTYKLELRYDFLPCLQVGEEQKPTYLPIEVCKIVPGQRFQKKLEDNQTSSMILITCQKPFDREGSIRQAVKNNNYNSTERANEFGIEVDYNPTAVQARILPPPMLKYHDSGPDNMCYPSNGAWNMRNKKVVNGARVVNWACVNFCHDLPENVIRHFCIQLAKMSRATGLNFDDLRLPIFSARPDQVQSDLRRCYQDARSRLRGQKIDFILALLPDKNGTLYGNIKRICETDIGLMSQCCLRRHVLEAKLQYLANLAIKINAKCGGRNSVFADIKASLPVVSNKPTIIFGADVTHPNALDDAAPSIASVVASQDWPEVTKYHGNVYAQGHREELIQGLESIVKDLLVAFQRETKQRPQQLIFYRDGVSEGQFKQVLEKEIPEIEKAWKALYNEKAPMTFIVVQKRHHTRLFPNDPRDGDNNGNVLPGTVVDRQICHPTEFDFFLCSHAGIKGTNRPAHYHVLRDDNKFTADALQSLTNNLCYTYASCTRSVSIAPPAYYAHKLAFRARFYQTQGSDVASEVSSSGGAPPVIKPLPGIKDELKRLMFYC